MQIDRIRGFGIEVIESSVIGLENEETQVLEANLVIFDA
jgi:hypothetical protein